MLWLSRPPIDRVIRRRDTDGEPPDDRLLRRGVERGELRRIAPGTYVPTADWQVLTPLARHAQLVWDAAARGEPGRVFGLFAAAALHGMDILGPWPESIDVLVDRRGGGRSTGRIRRHSRDLARVAVAPWGTNFVTTPLQTAVDLIAAVRHLEGVVVADQALWARRSGGPLVRHEDLLSAAHSRTGRGAARAARAADFATPLADSVRESQSRVLIQAMGFPEPELQAAFVLSDGSRAFADFFWRDHRHIGEFDGVGKYADPALLRGRTPRQALVAEKDREDDLRRQVDAFSRWRTPALDDPRVLYNILRGAGLPTRRPRPGR
ncbi:MAG: hypothetical protein ABWY03_03880 [Microbacterium sp.]